MDADTPESRGTTSPGSPAPRPLPATYGEVLKPLRLSALPEALVALHRDSALFREWLQAWDRVTRAEKVSSWTTWTLAERQAWDAEDVVGFSRLRGYTAPEIADYLAYLDLTRRLAAAHADDPDFTYCASQDVLQTLLTPAFEALEAHLQSLADGPPPRLRP
jgi:hypothetical protein